MLRQVLLVTTLMGLLGTASLCSDAQQWFGQAPINRGFADSTNNITFLDTQDMAPITGSLTAWQLYAMNTGPVTLEVFQPVSGGYKLIGQNPEVISSAGVITIPVASADQIHITAGDLIGFTYHQPSGVYGIISFNGVNGGGPEVYAYIYNLVDGAVYDIAGLSNGEHRTYSLQAQVSPSSSAVPEPGACALLASLGLTGAALMRRRYARSK